MNILIVNKFLYPNGGSETYIFKLGEYLTSQGHEVQYFGMEHEGRIVGNRVNAYTSDMDFHGASKLSKLTYPIRTIYSTQARKQIRKVLEDFQPDVVHLNNFNYQLTPSIILEIVAWREQASRKCRIVYTAHDYQLVCPNHMLRNPNIHQNCEKCLGGHFINCLKGKCIHGSTTKSAVGMMEAEYWKKRGAYKYIDTIICPSNFMKSKLDSNPLFKEKTVAIHNFIDIPEYEERKSEKKYVLYFGRLSEEKGIKTLIEVCRALPEINFVFVGTGSLTEEVKRVNNIDYKGFQQNDELWNLIENASFCVCPSEWNEVFSLTIGEAMALGTPVVASNIGGIPEIIGEGGELFTPGDIQELTHVIKELWNDESRITYYSKVAKAADRMTIGKYYAHLIRVGGVLIVLPQSKKYVLYFGRYSEEKGISTLIKSCTRLKYINFIFAGTGLLEDEMNGVSNIQNVGFLKGILLKHVIQNAWFSVYPSEWYENCPFSVMESQMNGTPVLGSKIGGIPELIRPGETGELFIAGDVDDLVTKMGELWNNETIILNYKRNCKHLYFDSIDKYCDKILKIYS